MKLYEYAWVSNTYYHCTEWRYYYIRAKWILGSLWQRKIARPWRRFDISLLDLDNEEKIKSTIY